MQREKIIIVGAGPCGLSAAIACKEKGFDPLIIEKENTVSAIYHYPTHQTFFSTAEKLEIGKVPFVTVNRKPKRLEALAYYREVVNRKELRINTYETVERIQKNPDASFSIHTAASDGEKRYAADYVIVATGYYDHPNLLGVEGENLPHVFHYFKEAHPYHQQNVVVIGGKNSAVDAALELHNAGARVTVIYRGETYSKSIKPWILPEFESLVRHGEIEIIFSSHLQKIGAHEVVYKKERERQRVPADFVFAMVGYHPDHTFLSTAGVDISAETGRPHYDSKTMETNVDQLFIAGVIAAGNNANEIFIESGRFHGDLIAEQIKEYERTKRESLSMR